MALLAAIQWTGLGALAALILFGVVLPSIADWRVQRRMARCVWREECGPGCRYHYR